MTLHELSEFVNMLIAMVRIPLDRKGRQLINKKMEEASRIIQDASKEDIEKYDLNFRELRQRIEDEEKRTGIRRRRNGDEAIAICQMIDKVLNKQPCKKFGQVTLLKAG